MKKEQQIAGYFRVYYLGTEGKVVDNGTRYDYEDNLLADFSDPNWAVVPAGQVPENWAEMTIAGGKLINK